MEDFEGQHHFQEPADLRDRKRWGFFFQPELEMPEKEVGQHTREHMMMPARILTDFIVVHPQRRFRFLEALFNGMITNDKFCCTRWGTLPLSWWRRPRRLRD